MPHRRLYEPLRNALLAIVGGLVLFVVVEALAGEAWFLHGLVLLCALPSATLFGFSAFDAVRSGAYPVKFRAIEREAEPIQFWGSVLLSGGAALIFAWFALDALIKLAGLVT